MVRVVLRNIPPGFNDQQIREELACISDLIEEITVSAKKSFNK